MKKLLLILCLVITLISNAQPVSHDITYSSSGLSTADNCNIFNDQSSPATIGGYEHYPTAGGATFDGTNIVLNTKYNTATSNNLGTAYAIKFPFKSGYNYSFQFTAKGTDGSGGGTNFPHIQVSLFNTLPDASQTHPADCGPVDENKWSVLGQNILGGFYITPLLVCRLALRMAYQQPKPVSPDNA